MPPFDARQACASLAAIVLGLPRRFDQAYAGSNRLQLASGEEHPCRPIARCALPARCRRRRAVALAPAAAKDTGLIFVSNEKIEQSSS